MEGWEVRVGLAYAGISDIGRVREQNQDAILLPAQESSAAVGAPWLFLLADGMGGASGGQVASTLAIQATADFFSTRATALEEEEALRQAVTQASAAVHQRALAQPELKGMGTTLVALAINGRRAVLANVGDSRGYLWRQGALRQITQDHSLVQQLVREGSLTPQEAREHKMRNVVTRAVGTHSQAVADIFTLELQPGDTLLLCSDGLHGPLNDGELARFLSASGPGLEGTARALVEEANRRGGPDNISVILVKLEQDERTLVGEPEGPPLSISLKPVPIQSKGGGKWAWLLGLAALLLAAGLWAYLTWQPPAKTAAYPVQVTAPIPAPPPTLPPASAPAPSSAPPAQGIELEPTAPSSGAAETPTSPGTGSANR